MDRTQWENNEEIEIFRQYLRIPTVPPNLDYTPCVEFLKRQAASLELPVHVIYPVNNTDPVVIMKWLGSQPELPSILLNSHTDVVPVFRDKWSHDPFNADLDEEGRIYGRGAQDMKSVGTQYLGAIRALKASGYQPKRTVYLTYVPNEETGKYFTMRKLVQGVFKEMNVGFSLDEGMASEDESFAVYYAERTLWHLHLKFSGTAGHGSLLLANTAGEKLSYVVNKFMEFRKSQIQRLADDSTIDIGDVTTVNLTQITGGVQSNVVPPVLVAVFDIRIAVTVDVAAFEKQIRDWCEEAGGGIELDFEMKCSPVHPTKIDASNPFWMAFKQALDSNGLKTRVRVFPATTDSYHIRQGGIPALGFSPINNTPILLHDHDEYLGAQTYLNGIEIYKKLIPAVADA